MTQVKQRYKALIFLCITLIGVSFFALNLLVGSVTIPWADFREAIMGDKDNAYHSIIMAYRLPQAITALFAGIGLSVSGLLMQTLFRNPLADPSILGISSGASLGVAFVVLLASATGGMVLSQLSWWSTIGVTIAAFIGAVFVLLLILALSTRLQNMVSLILVGIMIAYIAGAVTDVLKYLGQKEELHAFVIWGLGSFSNVSMAELPFLGIAVLVGSVLAFFMSKSLNLMILGERYAENLGVNIKRCNMFSILVSGFLTALVTAFCGPISFLGLAVPHLARFLFKSSDHFLLLPATALIGMDLALLCNLLSRLPGFEGNLPINSVTALIGAPIVLWVIFHHQKVKQ